MLACLGRSRSPSTVHLITADPLATISTRSSDTVYGVTRLNPLFTESGQWANTGGGGGGGGEDSEVCDDVFEEPAESETSRLPERILPEHSEPLGPTLRTLQTSLPGSRAPGGNEPPFTLPRQPSRGRELRLCGEPEPFTPPAPVWPEENGQEAPRGTVLDSGFAHDPYTGAHTWRAEGVTSVSDPGTVRICHYRAADVPTAGSLGRLLHAAEPPVSLDMAPDSLVTESLLMLTSPEFTPGSSLKPTATQDNKAQPLTARDLAPATGHHTLPLPNHSRRSVWSLHVDSPTAACAQSRSVWSLAGPETSTARAPPQRPRSADHTRPPIAELVSSSRAATMARRASAGSSPPIARRSPPSRSSQGRPDPQAVLDPMQFVLRLWEKTGMRTNGRRLLMNEPEVFCENPAPNKTQETCSSRPVPAPVHTSTAQHLPGSPLPAVDSVRPCSADSHVYSEISSVDLSGMVVHGTYAWCEVAPSYLNQLLPGSSSASSAASGRGSESSEGGSERRVTFSADTVDNEPRSSRPRRIYEAHGLKPTRPPPASERDSTHAGYYGSNLITALRSADKDKNIRTFDQKASELRVGDTLPLDQSVPLLARPRSRRWCLLMLLLVVLAALLAIVMLSSWYLTGGERWFGFI